MFEFSDWPEIQEHLYFRNKKQRPKSDLFQDCKFPSRKILREYEDISYHHNENFPYYYKALSRVILFSILHQWDFLIPPTRERTRFQLLIFSKTLSRVYFDMRVGKISVSYFLEDTITDSILNSTSLRILILLQDGLNDKFTRRYSVLIF